MLQREDSIQHFTAAAADSTRTDTVRHGPLTPAKVIGWLPADATPAQQDSMVQAHFKPDTIHWSGRPDTLCLPGMPADEPQLDISSAKIYNETYFTGKPFFHPELFGGRLGTAGEPIPYGIARDNVIVIMLLLCFMTTALGVSRSSHFVLKQAKMFFRTRRGDSAEDSGTLLGRRFQYVLALQSFLLFGLVYFFYAERYVADLFIIDNYAVIAAYSLAILGYAAVKALMYRLSGYVFFDRRSTAAWMRDYLFILCSEGVLLLPLVLLQAFFSMPIEATLACTAALVAAGRMLSLYKTYIIFFRQKRLYLQNILYFCTLELMPLAALAGLLGEATDYLKVSF